MAFFWRRRATLNADDSVADPVAVVRILEWLPGVNTPLAWETPAKPADADPAAAIGDADKSSSARIRVTADRNSVL